MRSIWPLSALLGHTLARGPLRLGRRTSCPCRQLPRWLVPRPAGRAACLSCVSGQTPPADACCWRLAGKLASALPDVQAPLVPTCTGVRYGKRSAKPKLLSMWWMWPRVMPNQRSMPGGVRVKVSTTRSLAPAAGGTAQGQGAPLRCAQAQGPAAPAKPAAGPRPAVLGSSVRRSGPARPGNCLAPPAAAHRSCHTHSHPSPLARRLPPSVQRVRLAPRPAAPPPAHPAQMSPAGPAGAAHTPPPPPPSWSPPARTAPTAQTSPPRSGPGHLRGRQRGAARRGRNAPPGLQAHTSTPRHGLSGTQQAQAGSTGWRGTRPGRPSALPLGP